MRITGENRLVAVECPLVFADGFERQPQVVERGGMARRSAQCALIGGDRCTCIACFAVAVAKMELGLRVVGVDRQDLLPQRVRTGAITCRQRTPRAIEQRSDTRFIGSRSLTTGLQRAMAILVALAAAAWAGRVA